jgi:hypothetical protein
MPYTFISLICVTCLIHSFLLVLIILIFGEVWIMQIFIMYFSQSSCYFLHVILSTLLSDTLCVKPQGEGPIFETTQTTGRHKQFCTPYFLRC